MSLFDTKDETELYSAEEIQSNKAVSIIAYFGFLFFVPLAAAPQSGYAKFHANQGFMLFIIEAAVSIVSSIMSACSAVPAFGFMFTISASVIGSIGGLATTVLFIVGLVNAAQGKARELPVVGGVRVFK